MLNYLFNFNLLFGNRRENNNNNNRIIINRNFRSSSSSSSKRSSLIVLIVFYYVVFNIQFVTVFSQLVGSEKTMEQFLDRLLHESVYDRRIRPFYTDSKSM
jgi:hypothetical protein